MITKVVSGGQTGVDRAALDVALEHGIPCGGWCPRGRRAEDGGIQARYPVMETPSVDYAQRTEWNVRDADGTLILTRGPATGGTALTMEIAHRLGKPCLIIDLDGSPISSIVRAWADKNRIQTLNIAGPRESTSPGIYERSRRFLRTALSLP
jgi:Circularly permutated YpsA SLOG family